MKRFVHPFFGKGSVIANVGHYTVKFRTIIRITRKIKRGRQPFIIYYKRWRDYSYEHKIKKFSKFKGVKYLRS